MPKPSRDVAIRIKVFILVLIVAVLALGLAYAIQQKNLRDIAVKTSQTPPSNGVVAPPLNEVVAPVQPTTTTQVLEDATKSIRVTNMAAGQRLPNGFLVGGTAVAFEGQFAWRVEESDGTVISHGFAMAHQPDAGIPGPFSFMVFLDAVPTSTAGALVLYEPSPKDGKPIHVLRIPVVFRLTTMTVNVYFGNTKMNPNAMDCSLVYPVERVVPEGVESWAAVHALLAGPNDAEKAAGYYSSIPPNVMIQGLPVHAPSMVEPIPGLDFNQALQEGVGGSCRVSAIRSEIEHTALQGDVQEAIDAGVPFEISIDGQTEGILQP